MDMALKERIQELVDAGHKKSELARAAKKTAGAVTQWLSGDTQEIKADSAAGLQELTGYSAVWIATGKGEKFAHSASSLGHVTKFGTPSATVGLPGAFETNPNTAKTVWVIGKGQGGMPERIWSDGDHPVGITDEYAEVHSADPHAFLVRVEGSSMWPKFEGGNYVLVEPGTEPELEDCVLVRLETGQTLIKRLLSRRHGYKLGSFNDPQILEYPREQVTWCYYIAHEVPRRKIKSRH